MCAYCMIGDHFFRHDPPWTPNPMPQFVPQPLPNVPSIPWSLDRLKEFEDMLRRVKELEDRLGCPCEPNKADYLGMLRERIYALEKKAAE